MNPTELSVDEDSLVIEWSDASIQKIRIKELRDRCPCANCREKRSGEPKGKSAGLAILSLEETQPIGLSKMEPVGNYAYAIHFSDGHSNGIFTFDFLRSF